MTNAVNKPHPALSEQQWQHAITMAKAIGVRPETLLPANKGFVTPGPLEIIAFKQWTGRSTIQLAKMLGVNPKTPRAWMATKNPDNYRPIVSCYWWYWLALFGVIELEIEQPYTDEQNTN